MPAGEIAPLGPADAVIVYWFIANVATIAWFAVTGAKVYVFPTI